MTGRLYLVSTPIGNLEDLTARAREVLAAADVLACEDTRRTRRLTAHLGISKRLISLHEHNERKRAPQLLSQLEDGLSVALVSDAGTPLLSDPGYPLVRGAIERGIPVVPVPGPSAILAALVASGLPTYPFTFLGFAPPKRARRRRFFEQHAEFAHTLVYFESPHRIVASLEDAATVFGDRPAAIGREMTKLHEEILRGTLAALHAELRDRAAVKGEFTVVVGGKTG